MCLFIRLHFSWHLFLISQFLTSLTRYVALAEGIAVISGEEFAPYTV